MTDDTFGASAQSTPRPTNPFVENQEEVNEVKDLEKVVPTVTAVNRVIKKLSIQ